MQLFTSDIIAGAKMLYENCDDVNIIAGKYTNCEDQQRPSREMASLATFTVADDKCIDD